MIVVFSALVLLILYRIRVNTYRNLWIRQEKYPETKGNTRDSLNANNSHEDPIVSVIVPFRNEYKNISPLIEGLSGQSHTYARLKIILVDDHSSDGSAELISSLIKGNTAFMLLQLPEGQYGKKAAIDHGISNSAAELIILTDADCRHEPKWIVSIVGFYKNNQCRLISGPVGMVPGKTFSTKFQSLEFLSLTGAGGASFLHGKPIMCSAANLSFEKSLYIEARDHLHLDFPSGDDMFLMLYLNRHHPGEALFLPDKAAIVWTPALNGLRAFFRQRTRWSSKALLYRDLNVMYMALLVLLLNLIIVLCIALGITDPFFLWVAGSLVGLKMLIDYPFLRAIAKFLGQSELLKYFIPSQIIYPFYIVIIAFSGFFAFFAGKKSS